MKIPEIDLLLVAPEIIITAFGFLVLLLDVLFPKGERKGYLGVISLIGILFAGFYTVPQIGSVRSGFEGMFISDGYAVFFKLTFLIIAFLTILICLMGIYPKLFFGKMEHSVEKFIKDVKGRVEMKADLPSQNIAEIKK